MCLTGYFNLSSIVRGLKLQNLGHLHILQLLLLFDKDSAYVLNKVIKDRLTHFLGDFADQAIDPNRVDLAHAYHTFRCLDVFSEEIEFPVQYRVMLEGKDLLREEFPLSVEE